MGPSQPLPTTCAQPTRSSTLSCAFITTVVVLVRFLDLLHSFRLTPCGRLYQCVFFKITSSAKERVSCNGYFALIPSLCPTWPMNTG